MHAFEVRGIAPGLPDQECRFESLKLRVELMSREVCNAEVQVSIAPKCSDQ